MWENTWTKKNPLTWTIDQMVKKHFQWFDFSHSTKVLCSRHWRKKRLMRIKLMLFSTSFLVWCVEWMKKSIHSDVQFLLCSLSMNKRLPVERSIITYFRAPIIHCNNVTECRYFIEYETVWKFSKKCNLNTLCVACGDLALHKTLPLSHHTFSLFVLFSFTPTFSLRRTSTC